MGTLTIEIPAELLDLAELPGATPSESAVKLLALELFREHRTSLGRAAELAGLSIEEFMDFSAHRQVPLHYTAAELAEDRAAAATLKL